MALTRDQFFWDAFVSHAEKSVKAGALLLELVKDPSRSSELQLTIRKLESEGDDITHQVMSALHKTWITPLDREEIHRLIKTLDDLLDAIEEAGERFRVYHVNQTRDEAVRMATAIAEMSVRVAEAIKGLRSMKHNQDILKLLIEINDRESDADHALSAALERLFRDETNAVEVVKWRDLFQRLEAGADAAEEIAHVVEGIVLEHA